MMVELSVIRDLVAIFGVIAGFSYYVITVQNTEKSREAQIFMQIMARATDPRWRKGLAEIRAFNFKGYKEFKQYFDENPEKWENVFYFYQIMDDLGGLVRGGFIGIEILAYTYMGPFITGWEKSELYVEGWREDLGSPKVMDGVEYLYNELITFTKKHPELKP